jgi:hypothetical protein
MQALEQINMSLQQAPPFSARPLDSNGNWTNPWRSWLQSLMNLDNQISVSLTDIYTDSAHLATTQFGRTIKFNNVTKNIICYLPKVADIDIGGHLQIIKLGTGNLRIQAASNAQIGKSTFGGGLISGEPERQGANVTLHVESSIRWSVDAGLGIWYVV